MTDKKIQQLESDLALTDRIITELQSNSLGNEEKLKNLYLKKGKLIASIHLIKQNLIEDEIIIC